LGVDVLGMNISSKQRQTIVIKRLTILAIFMRADF
jgi:hypothetical protein